MFERFFYRFLCPFDVIFSTKNKQWHTGNLEMGTIQDTKIANEPARLWTSMGSKNPH